MGIETAAIGLGAAGLFAGADSARRSANIAGDAASQANQLALMPRSTGLSNINPRGGTVYIDPRIRAMREQSLANIPGYQQQLSGAYGNYMGQLGGLYNQLGSNANPFLQAQTAPLMQAQAQASGNLTRDQGMRGISGSSFGDQALTNLNTDYGRAIGNAGALATQQTIGAQEGLAGQMFGAAGTNVAAQQGLQGQYASVANQNLAQELSALGLSQADIGSILQGGQLGASAQAGYGQAIGQGLGSMGQLMYGLSPYYRNLGSSTNVGLGQSASLNTSGLGGFWGNE
jgi:hypothetical protein